MMLPSGTPAALGRWPTPAASLDTRCCLLGSLIGGKPLAQTPAFAPPWLVARLPRPWPSTAHDRCGQTSPRRQRLGTACACFPQGIDHAVDLQRRSSYPRQGRQRQRWRRKLAGAETLIAADIGDVAVVGTGEAKPDHGVESRVKFTRRSNTTTTAGIDETAVEHGGNASIHGQSRSSASYGASSPPSQAVERADRMYAIGRALHLRRHRSPSSRSFALQLFRQCLELRPDWTVTDTRLSVDKGINDVLAAFARGEDLCGTDNGVAADRSTGNGAAAKRLSSLDKAAAVACFRSRLDTIGFNARCVQASAVSSLGPIRNSLDVAIRLFLLGLALPWEVVHRMLGSEAIESARLLGLLGDCPVNTQLAVSLVQLFPLDADALPADIGDDTRLQGATPRADRDARQVSASCGISDDQRLATADGAVAGAGEASRGAVSPAEMIFATDWPPPGSTALTEEPVMYIGPDSIGLVQHAPRPRDSTAQGRTGPEGVSTWNAADGDNASHADTILDLCCGSGVQGISAAVLRGGRARVTFVDINPRAVRFARFNAVLNGLDGRDFRAVVGNLYEAVGEHALDGVDVAYAAHGTERQRLRLRGDSSVILGTTAAGVSDCGGGTIGQLADTREGRVGRRTEPRPRAASLSGHDRGPSYDLILANPPFVPVPPKLDYAARRYDVFASGGASGEDVVEGIFRGVVSHLRPGGVLAMVSELANPLAFGDKLERWISGDLGGPARGAAASWNAAVLHEARPWTAKEYAARRAGSAREADGWERHLEAMGIVEMAPGFVFVQRRHRLLDRVCTDAVETAGIDKVWAPHNVDAVARSDVMLRRMKSV